MNATAWGVRILCAGRTGTGAPLSPTLVLTCQHVVRGQHEVKVRDATGELVDFLVRDADAELDVALLQAATPGARLAAGAALTLRALWRGIPLPGGRAVLALCTDEVDTPRSIKVEVRPAPRGARRVQFGVLARREGVRPGYSGAPVVELDQRSQMPRVLGLVRARDRDSLDELDSAGAGWFVPTERIAERFDEVRAFVETPVERDSAWATHWEPRSRGVVSASEPGFFFTGRVAACARLDEHLRTGAGLLVVTGRRGHGKSAVLAHTVVRASPRYLASIDAREAQALAGGMPPRPLDAAVMARGKSTATVAGEIATQLGLPASDPDEVVAACERDRSAPRIVIDAVDESTDPGMLMRELLVGLAEAGACLAIGTLAAHIRLDAPDGTGWLDLDDPRYGDDAIPEYIERRLRASGRYERNTARTVARAVARRASGNFLVAELVARTLVQRSFPLDIAAPRWAETLPLDVTDAFRGYLARFGAQRERVLALLHPLAHAYGNGLTLDPPDAWLATANALRPDTIGPFEHADLRHACKEASDYLISTSGSGQRRLYHEGLANAIINLSAQARGTGPIEPAHGGLTAAVRNAAAQRFVNALCSLLPELDAPDAAYDVLDPYLLEHLATHLGAHGDVEELLDRPGLLLTAEPLALRGALVRGALTVPAAREQSRAALVHALQRPYPSRRERVAAMCAAMRRQGERNMEHRLLGAWSSQMWSPRRLRTAETSSDAEAQLPYELISAPRLPLAVATISDADPGGWPSSNIEALAAIEYEGELLIVSAGRSGLRSWRLDGRPGALAQAGAHHAVELAWHEGEPLAIVATDARSGHPSLCGWRLDGTPAPKTASGVITRRGWIGCMAVVMYDGEPIVVTGTGSTIRSWRLDGSCGPMPTVKIPSDHVGALAVLICDGQPLVVCGGSDGAVRSWHLDGRVGPLAGEHGAWVKALAVLEHDGRPLVVAAGHGGALRSWWGNGAPGPLALQLDVRGVRALAACTVRGEAIVITSGGDGHLLSWHPDGIPGPFAHIDHHAGTPEALAVYEHEQRPLLISGGGFGRSTISAWRLDGPSAATQRQSDAHAYQLDTLVRLGPGGRDADASHVAWRLGRSRTPDMAPNDAHGYRLFAIAVTEHDGAPLVISAGQDEVTSHVTICSWRLDGTSGPLDRSFKPRWLQDSRWIGELTVVEHDGEPLVVTAGDAGIQSWRIDGRPGPLSRTSVHPQLNSYTKEYDDTPQALVVIDDGGELLIVTGGADAAIRSCRIDGASGSLTQPHADTHWIGNLAVAWHAGRPLVIIGGNDGTLRSWHLDGTAGPFARERAISSGAVRELAVLHHERRALVICAGDEDTQVRSWWLDGTPGPLTIDERVSALAVLERPGEPWVLTGSHDGTIRSWLLDGTPAGFVSEGAHVGSVTELRILRYAGRTRVISAGSDLLVLAHRLD